MKYIVQIELKIQFMNHSNTKQRVLVSERMTDKYSGESGRIIRVEGA